MRYREYKPIFFGGDQELNEFDIFGMDELLASDCVASRFSKDDNFSRFYLCRDGDELVMSRLIASMKSGRFYVVGYIWGTRLELEKLGLEEWSGDRDKDHG